MILQGDDFESVKPVVISSRTTSNAERRYPQLDLEATGIATLLFVDFGIIWLGHLKS